MQKCQCGRTKIHCPYCGYAGLAGQAKLTRVVDENTIYSYRCRKCVRVFDDLSMRLCRAPHINETRTNKIADQVDESLKNLSVAERKRWVTAKLRHEPYVPAERTEGSVADEIDSKLNEKEES